MAPPKSTERQGQGHPSLRASASELAAAIDRVRSQRTANLKSNYFFGRLRSTEFPLWVANQSLVFLDREHDFRRLYFLSSDVDELSGMAREIPERPLVVDYVTRDNDHDAIDQAFSAAGFRKAAIYRRMVNNNLPARKTASKITPAEEHEADLLFEQLCEHFDVRLDHVPERDEFAELVRRRQVLVHRVGNEIDGYTVYQLRGRRAHWSYWYTRPGSDRAVAFKLITDFLTEMAAKGVKASFLWVETHNAGVATVHHNLGFDFDGVVTHVYVKD